MARRIFFSILILVGLVILQTTLLRHLPFRGISPDIAMLVLLFISHRNGNVSGQVCGFVSGLVEDFLSIAPLGFHTFIKTLLGFLFGSTSGRMFIDPFLMPAVFALVATIIKALFAGFLSFLFNLQLGTGPIFSVGFLIELGLNIVTAPFLFFLTGLLKFLYPVRREEAL